MTKIDKIYEKLEDNESKIIFRARISNNDCDDDHEYFDMLAGLNKTYRFQGDSSPYFRNHTKENRKFILFGGGADFNRYLRTLQIIGYDASFVCDNKKELKGCLLNGIPCISFDELLKIWQEYFIIISSTKYKEQIYAELIQAGVSVDNIYQTASNRLVAWNEELYFRNDIFKKDKNEIFVDCGAYIGDTVKGYIDWNPEYKKIYAFEPEKASFDTLVSNYQKDNIICINAGLGSKAGEAGFYGDCGHGRVSLSGSGTIPIVSIDEAVGDDRVTMIKMDIEGSELEALKGAKNTIMRNLPKLAICLYHKKDDIYEIPAFINEIAPQYRFYIRNISADLNDLILYATV